LRVQEANQIIQNTNIKIEYSHELKTSEELISWLSENTINCYFYDDMHEYGIASSPDYAMTAKRPIAVHRTSQLKYIWENVPTSNAQKYSLSSIINKGFQPYEDLYNRMQVEKVVCQFDEHIESIMQKHKGKYERHIL